jgi:hypothetical protein
MLRFYRWFAHSLSSAPSTISAPLVLNTKCFCAPGLLAITDGMDDVDGPSFCVVLVVLSLASLRAARKYLSLSEYASAQRCTGHRHAAWANADDRLAGHRVDLSR